MDRWVGGGSRTRIWYCVESPMDKPYRVSKIGFLDKEALGGCVSSYCVCALTYTCSVPCSIQ